MRLAGNAHFDPETLKLLQGILLEAVASLPVSERSNSSIINRLAANILLAASKGERDPKRIRSLALGMPREVAAA